MEPEQNKKKENKKHKTLTSFCIRNYFRSYFIVFWRVGWAYLVTYVKRKDQGHEAGGRILSPPSQPDVVDILHKSRADHHHLWKITSLQIYDMVTFAVESKLLSIGILTKSLLAFILGFTFLYDLLKTVWHKLILDQLFAVDVNEINVRRDLSCSCVHAIIWTAGFS